MKPLCSVRENVAWRLQILKEYQQSIAWNKHWGHLIKKKPEEEDEMPVKKLNSDSKFLYLEHRMTLRTKTPKERFTYPVTMSQELGWRDPIDIGLPRFMPQKK